MKVEQHQAKNLQITRESRSIEYRNEILNIAKSPTDAPEDIPIIKKVGPKDMPDVALNKPKQGLSA